MNKKEVVIVTGMSGAGKTSAMACFENMEYLCVDNYPVALLEQFGELIKTDTSYQKIAMAVSLKDAMHAIRLLTNMDWVDLSVVFLDCNDEVILKRYKETRRTHPVIISNKASTLSEAIEFERILAKPIANHAKYIIDTSSLKFVRLQRVIENYFRDKQLGIFRISFVSFGYKHGIPKESDLLFDVRFLPNPFYIEELRPQTGNDKAVYDYVMKQDETNVFINKIEVLLDYLFEQYQKEGKMHVIVGIGCTGGQHRSVSIANYLSKAYQDKYQINCLHRDAAH